MKEFIYRLIFAAFIVSSSSAFSATEDRHAVEFSIGTDGHGAFEATHRKLRLLIGNAVSNNVIDKFVIYGYYEEPGFFGCVEDRPRSTAPTAAFEKFVKRLKAIIPQPGVIYSIKRVKTCPALPVVANKPATVQVAKSDGSIACEPGTGTALSDMQKELADIAVYSAEKLSDGMMRPAVCGIPTGQYNVYEIAETDLDQAIALGFMAWSEITALPNNLVGQATMNLALTAITPKYKCDPLTVQGGIELCIKSKISPPPKQFVKVYNQRCPGNTPDNCPLN